MFIYAWKKQCYLTYQFHNVIDNYRWSQPYSEVTIKNCSRLKMSMERNTLPRFPLIGFSCALLTRKKYGYSLELQCMLGSLNLNLPLYERGVLSLKRKSENLCFSVQIPVCTGNIKTEFWKPMFNRMSDLLKLLKCHTQGSGNSQINKKPPSHLIIEKYKSALDIAFNWCKLLKAF